MMKLWAMAALCAAGVSAAHAQAGTLYGVATFSTFGTQSLYAIDAGTGAASLIGSTGLRQIMGLDWDGGTGRLMALTAAGDAFALDTGTGASTLVTDANFGVSEGSVAYAGGVAFTTIFDNLHTFSGGAWQQVGPSFLAPGADISGLDFGGSQLLGLALNGAGADQLVSFDALTGTAAVLGATGTNASTVGGLAHAFLGGAWYMTDGATLYSLDASTGAATSIGSHGVAGFSGLAFVPAPGTLALAGLCGLGGRVVSRRRR